MSRKSTATDSEGNTAIVQLDDIKSAPYCEIWQYALIRNGVRIKEGWAQSERVAKELVKAELFATRSFKPEKIRFKRTARHVTHN